MKIKDFIQEKYPITKGRMGKDLLHNISGQELAELITEYMSVGENDVLHGVINWVASSDTEPKKDGLYYCITHGGTEKLLNYKNKTWWRQSFNKQVTGVTHWRERPEPLCL